MAELLDMDRLCVRDTRHIILSELTMHVGRGEKVALVGESGCGKTMSIRTLLHMLPDDVSVTSGALTFDGTDVLSLRSQQLRQELYSRVGFVAQNTSASLHPLLRISTQMTDFYLERHRGVRRTQAVEKAAGILRSLGMRDVDRVLSSRPDQLSGGMRQRINIAIALMDDILLLVADEPTSALDAHVRRQIEEVYISLAERSCLAMLLVSHDLGFVRRMADRVYVMYAGKMVEEGLVDEIFSDPVHPYTRSLIALANVKYKNKDEDLAQLGGFVPVAGRESRSCAFASRCRYERADCMAAVEYRRLSDTHYVRCWR